MTDEDMSLSICIQVYRGSGTLRRALTSLFGQELPRKTEIIIADDTAPENKTERQRIKKIINSFVDPRIKFIQNKKNLGSALNIKHLVNRTKGDIIFFLCQDDILLPGALEKTRRAFSLDKNVGCVTRPFFWFDDDPARPVRAAFPLNAKSDQIISIFDSEKTICSVFNSVGQVSGLAFRRKFLENPFEEDTFIGHVAPFLNIWKKHKCVFLKDFTVAVEIKTSQTRHKPEIYQISPLSQWVNMFKTVFKEEKYQKVRDIGIKNIATHYTGLVQIKNFGSYRELFREIILHVGYCARSLINPKFYAYALLTIIIPRKILIWLTDNYKKFILASYIDKFDCVCNRRERSRPFPTASETTKFLLLIFSKFFSFLMGSMLLAPAAIFRQG